MSASHPPGWRLALTSRSFLSGEDPYLGYQLVQPVVRGIQSKGVIANAKHYVNNNQETDRSGGNEVVDERTRWEIYYPPFLGAIKAEVGSIMCSCAHAFSSSSLPPPSLGR